MTSRIRPATRAISNYRKMKVRTTSLPCRVMEAQRLIEEVRLSGSGIQQLSVRKMLEKTKGLEIICNCHDDRCAFVETEPDGTHYCTCTDWESTTRPALKCRDLNVIGHEGNRVFKIGEGFIHIRSHETNPRHQGIDAEASYTLAEEYINTHTGETTR
jgi:hypothetical protein